MQHAHVCGKYLQRVCERPSNEGETTTSVHTTETQEETLRPGVLKLQSCGMLVFFTSLVLFS